MRGPRFEGPRVLAAIALALAAMTAALLAFAGTGEEGVRVLIRATARSSVLLFGLAFTASSLRRLLRVPATAWLLRNRRQVGLGMALSHAIHLAGIVVLVNRWPEHEQVTLAALLGGGTAYLFLAAMAATSSDRAVAWLGRGRWRALHLTGSWVVFAIFAVSYLPRAARSPSYLPLAAFLLALPALRLAARRALLRQGATARSASPSS